MASIAKCAATPCRPPPTTGRACHDSVLDATRPLTDQPTWQGASEPVALAQDQAAAAHPAADCRVEAAPWAAAVPQAAHRRSAREVWAVQWDQAAPALEEYQEVAWAGLDRG
jgi:hypothetical protein